MVRHEELKLLDMLAAIIQNLASHPTNRTRLYKAELQGATALDRALEGPASPEPCDTSSNLLATRVPGSLRRGGSIGRLCASPPPALPSLPGSCRDPGGSFMVASAAGRATGVRATERAGRQGSSPAAAAGEQVGKSGAGKRCRSSMAGALGTGLANYPSANIATGRNPMLTASLDSALSAASMLRPKVILPPITKLAHEAARGSLDQTAAVGYSTIPDTQAPVNQDALATALKKPNRPEGTFPQGPPSPSQAATGHGASTAFPKSIIAVRSGRSRAGTSTWGSPGSPIAPPTSKEQFLIWMDSTFNDHTDQQEGGLEDGGSGGGAGGMVVRTARRMLWDEQGEWLDVEPETSKGLQRLLCRPLSHLWQETPESRARAGRWLAIDTRIQNLPVSLSSQDSQIQWQQLQKELSLTI